jgi:hypothetical protein
MATKDAEAEEPKTPVREKRVFPDPSSTRHTLATSKVTSALEFNGVKNKRQSVMGSLMASDNEGPKTPTSEERNKEIDNIRKMLAKGEVRPGLIKRTKHERVNKPLNKMTPAEKKQHTAFLWNLVREWV